MNELLRAMNSATRVEMRLSENRRGSRRAVVHAIQLCINEGDAFAAEVLTIGLVRICRKYYGLKEE